MLTLEKSELIDRILAHQRELSIPVETKKLRVLRMIVTSLFILIALAFYKPIAAHAPPIVNLFIEIVLGVGSAYLIAQAWTYVRWVPDSLQVFAGGVLVAVLVSLYIVVGLVMAPSKPGRARLSLSEFVDRAKRGDLSRIETKGLATSGPNWKIAQNEGEETYRRLTLVEARAYCEDQGFHVPASREEILALLPRPQVSRTLSFWTLEGRAYQYSGRENETLGVSVSGGAQASFYLLCLR